MTESLLTCSKKMKPAYIHHQHSQEQVILLASWGKLRSSGLSSGVQQQSARQERGTGLSKRAEEEKQEDVMSRNPVRKLSAGPVMPLTAVDGHANKAEDEGQPRKETCI